MNQKPKAFVFGFCNIKPSAFINFTENLQNGRFNPTTVERTIGKR